MFKRPLSLAVIICFFLTSLTPLPQAHADTTLNLSAPGTMINLSPAYQPVIIRGLTIHKDNPFLFDFIVDVGQDKVTGEPLKKEGEKLIKYFLASLAIPDKDMWVNLSPYEKSRMIPEALGQTDMGRDLLEQDYVLKQITASLIYPEKQLGKKFWDRVYSKAQQMYGTTQIPVNTFNKVWIMADKAEVFEHNQTAFVVNSHLKVMLEEDYLALSRHVIPAQAGPLTGHSQELGIHSLGSQIVKSIVLPELEKEVNTGKNFANLRQIFNSIILASWYKRNLKEALLNQVYSNKSKINGINLNDPTIKQQIYDQYLKAYRKGVFNYIKEDVNNDGASMPRKYFSGGIAGGRAVDPTKVNFSMGTQDMAQLPWNGEWSLTTGFTTNPGITQAANPNAAMVAAKDLVKAKKDGSIKEGEKYTDLDRKMADIFTWFQEIGTDLSKVKVSTNGSVVVDYYGDKMTVGPETFAKGAVAVFDKLAPHFHIEEGTVQPLDELDDLSKPLPRFRWVWTIPESTPAGTPTQVMELHLMPMHVQLNPDEVLLRVYAVPTEANGARWIPMRKPVDLFKLHGHPFHVPGNNPVGQIVRLGKVSKQHRKLGELVVTHNGEAADPLAVAGLRGDVSLQQTVRGYDGFRDDQDSPMRAGGHAQYVVAKWWQAMPKPPQLTFEQAATYPLSDPTIANSFALNRLGPNDTLLVIGASGSTGLAAIEYAKLRGVKRVIGIVSSEEKAQFIKNLSTPKTQVLAMRRDQFDFKTPQGVQAFSDKVENLNGGKPADVALDFLGEDYPNAFFASVKKGDPNDPNDLGGRFTSFGAELTPKVYVHGTEASSTAKVMMDRVEHFRDREDTEQLLKENEKIWANDPVALAKIQKARETAVADRQIKRVVIYGADKGALEALKAAQARNARVVMIVGQKDVDKIETLKKRKGVIGVINIAEYFPESKLDSKRLTNDIKTLFGKLRPDLVVERADPNEVLGITNGTTAVNSMINFSLGLLDTGGQVIYFEKTAGRVFPYFETNWVMQKDILFPDRSIILTHYAPIAMTYLVNNWVTEGKVKVSEPMVNTFENTPQELEAMGGSTPGKRVVLQGIPPGLTDLSSLQKPVSEAAIKVVEPGGIDLNTSSGMQWKDTKEGKGVEMDVNPAMVARIEREGINWLSPVIYKMTPIASIWPMVGLQAPAQQASVVGA